MKREILITDAHVGAPAERRAEFFRMLARLEAVEGDLVFLGDIFELWIALPRYETDLHLRFLDWTRRESRRRSVGFMEGNHEFFVARERADAFSWCTDRACHAAGGVLYVHGDQIDRRDVRHRSFRRLTRNPLAAALLRAAPDGPRLAAGIAAFLKPKNRRTRSALPLAAVQAFADARLGGPVHTLIVGHFHEERRLAGARAGRLYLLPDWQSSGKVTVYDKETRTAVSRRWNQLD